MTSAERPGAGTRETLLAAAREELAEHGRSSVSLRAVARRADLSHAAPGYFFSGRAGLLTAVAAQGFADLTDHLRGVDADAPDLVAALGHAYVDFGLAHPALFDLMFSPGELAADDPDLLAAQQASIGVLVAAVTDDGHATDAPASTDLALARWAFVHGLVVLARDGVLGGPTGTPAPDGAALAHRLVDLHARPADCSASAATASRPTRRPPARRRRSTAGSGDATGP